MLKLERIDPSLAGVVPLAAGLTRLASESGIRWKAEANIFAKCVDRCASQRPEWLKDGAGHWQRRSLLGPIFWPIDGRLLG
jgi:hypothetical protein